MRKPTRTQHDLTTTERGALALVAWGRLTASEAAVRLGVDQMTVTRWLLRFYNIGSPRAARRHYADRLFTQAEGTGRRALVRFQMEQAARAATDLRDFVSANQPTPTTDTK